MSIRTWIAGLLRERGSRHESLCLGPVTDWNEYWHKRLADDPRWDRVKFGISPFRSLVGGFENSWHRILVVGCGISTEPALLAHLGYEVLAIDVSEVAISHMKEHPPTEEELGKWLDDDLPESVWSIEGNFKELALSGDALRQARSAALKQLARSGGSLTNECIGFQNLTAATPFDVVYSPWSWQCLDEAGRSVLPRSAFTWLAPGGCLYFATQNLTGDRDELAAVCASAGFLRRHEESDKLLTLHWPTNEQEWKEHNRACKAEDLTLRGQLATGAKMWTAFHASG